MRIVSCRVSCMAAVCLLAYLQPSISTGRADETPTNHRTPVDDADLRYWLQNMVWHHRFSPDEIEAATGLNAAEIETALEQFNVRADNRPARRADAPLLVVPYPGGRHPRIGFLDGAVRPQRETKVSVFVPWNNTDYVVVDVPEAIWSNLGLTYLAHTHIATVWTNQNVELERLEWTRHKNGRLTCRRRLPNGIEFAVTIVPTQTTVMMEMVLTNGSDETLSDLRVQNCVMLKGARGFAQQTNDNKVMQEPYVACRSEQSGDNPDEPLRWIITAWEPCHRAWANQRCPCLHSDPKFPDCAPDETKRLVGRLSFYKGADVETEFRRIEQTGWRDWKP